MNTGETTRPSLIAGNGHSPASGGGRILADMEQRKPERPRAPRRAPAVAASRRTMLLWLAGVIVLVLLLLAVIRAWHGAPLDRAQTFDDRTPSVQALPAPTAGDDAPDVARIVDAPVDAADADADPFRRLGAAPAAAPATDASPEAVATVARASPTPAAAPTSRPAASRRAAAASTADDASSVDSGLFNTLMRIIHPEGGAPATGERHESMDALVAQIRDDDARTRARLESLGGPQQTAAAPESRRVARVRQQVEQALAACPKANTPAGIACRDRICAPHAGRLAACPL